MRRLIVIAALLVGLSGRAAYAGGIDFHDGSLHYDSAAGVVLVCGRLNNYRYSAGENQDEIALVAIQVDDQHDAHGPTFAYMYLWNVSRRFTPCFELPVAPHLTNRLRVFVTMQVEFAPRGTVKEVVAAKGASPALKAIERTLLRDGDFVSLGNVEPDLRSSVRVYLKLNDKVPGQEIDISPGTSDKPLVFSWEPLGLPLSATIEYQYRLYPTQLDWSNASSGKTATLTFIPAGIHVFQVQAIVTTDHGSKVWLEPAQYQFTIEQPYIGPGVTKGVTAPGHRTDAPLVTYSRRRALLVGVVEYDNMQFPRLDFVENDVKAVRDALRKQGFRDEDVHMVNSNRATSSQIDTAIDEFLKDIRDGEQSVIYLSGHGFSVGDAENDQSYFAGADCDRNKTASCVSLGIVKEKLTNAMAQRATPRHLLLIVDACAAGNTIVAKGYSDERALMSERAVQIITAGTRGQIAQEDHDQKLSMFMRFLVEGMNGAADMNNDKIISLSELMVWVRWKVSAASSGGQIPSFVRIKGAGEMIFDSPLH